MLYRDISLDVYKRQVFIEGEPIYENARIKGHMAYIPDDMFYFLQSDTINMMPVSYTHLLKQDSCFKVFLCLKMKIDVL